MIITRKPSEEINCVDALRYLKLVLTNELDQNIQGKPSKWIFYEMITKQGVVVKIPINTQSALKAELRRIQETIYSVTGNPSDKPAVWNQHT